MSGRKAKGAPSRPAVDSSGEVAASLTSIIERLKRGAEIADNDSYLIRLCGEFETQQKRHAVLCDAVGMEKGSPAIDVLMIYHDILAEIRDLAPRTLPGLIAKARVVSLMIRETHEDLDGDLECLDPDQEIALALAENLMAFGEARR